MGITAYEFIVYKEEKQERLEQLQNGELTKQEWEELEKAAADDMRKKKKSKIIHQIAKEDKAAYKAKIIARNQKARERTANNPEDNKNQDSHQNEKYNENSVIKAAIN